MKKKLFSITYLVIGFGAIIFEIAKAAAHPIDADPHSSAAIQQFAERILIILAGIVFIVGGSLLYPSKKPKEEDIDTGA